MAQTDAARVAEARRWHRAIGYEPLVAGGVTLVTTPAFPDTWEANWAQAGPDADAAALFAALDTHHPSGCQAVVVDALTPPAVEAALALADFRAESVFIEMVATRVTGSPTPPIFATEPVGDVNWERFVALVEIDQREGRRTGEHDEAVGAGLIDAMRRRLTRCDYWLLVEEGVDAGYGMTVACPNGLGLIESLFTLPARRGRGLMSAFIADAAARLRAEGCGTVFLDAHAHDTPKHLYARLGFAPVAVTRTWVRQV